VNASTTPTAAIPTSGPVADEDTDEEDDDVANVVMTRRCVAVAAANTGAAIPRCSNSCGCGDGSGCRSRDACGSGGGAGGSGGLTLVIDTPPTCGCGRGAGCGSGGAGDGGGGHTAAVGSPPKFTCGGGGCSDSRGDVGNGDDKAGGNKDSDASRPRLTGDGVHGKGRGGRCGPDNGHWSADC